MGKVLAKEKSIVLPGEVIAQGMDILPSRGTIREEEEIIATVIGLPYIKDKVISIIPLRGPYMPKRGEQILGSIIETTFYGWNIDIGTPYRSSLSLRDAVSGYVYLDRIDHSRYFKLGDILVAKIIKVETGGFIKLTTKGPGLKKLYGGKLVKITPSKIPRLIGRKGSMINIIKNKTNCMIIAGQNGWVWIKGESLDEIRAAKAVNLINKQSHISGLTDKIEKMLKR